MLLIFREEVVAIDDLIATIRQIQKVPDSARLERLQDALGKLDDDKDGAIPVDDLLKVFFLQCAIVLYFFFFY